LASPSDSAQWRLFVKHEEIIKLQKYLQHKFGNRSIDVRPRPKQDDSVELYLGDEFIGLIYLDEDEGERSYMVQISILDIDLDEVS
jgi:hypothetical protein|tara:strand:+ start:74 stop:331 length:258 start_codon:yes stop_codon:yes gene_type:complete